MNWKPVIQRLQKECGIEFTRGLTSSECESAELAYGFVFPEDLKQFLGVGLPQGNKFPDWRDTDSSRIRASFAMPLTGILFDVEHNGFWLPEWGDIPTTFPEASRVVTQLLLEAPTLIPIYGHRMMPDRPLDAGNPVFSIHQTDIIYYGLNLMDYLEHEFLKGADDYIRPEWKPRKIDFWDEDRFQTRWQAGPIRFNNRDNTFPGN